MTNLYGTDGFKNPNKKTTYGTKVSLAESTEKKAKKGNNVDMSGE